MLAVNIESSLFPRPAGSRAAAGRNAPQAASRTLVVTGAGGFLGAAISRLAVASGWRTGAISRRQPAKGVEWRGADFRNAYELGAAFSGAGVVIHSAGLAHQHGGGAPSGGGFEEINVEGTRRALLAAIEAGVGHFILISSVSVYGSVEGIPDESYDCAPLTPYARSKFQGEQAARRLVENQLTGRGTRLTILRMGTLYGPGDPGNVARLMDRIDQGRFVFPGSGRQRKSLLHVEDAAEACLVAARAEALGTANVAGPAASMREIVSMIVELLGRDKNCIRSVPGRFAGAAGWLIGCAGRFHPSAQALADSLERFQSTDEFDSSRFASATGFTPRIPLYVGLAQQAAWHRARRLQEFSRMLA